MKNATFRQLRIFTEVAHHLSFSKAASALHLTPPAVTMQVKDLESQIGFPLFERKGKTTYLTTGGEYMLVYARKLLGTLKDAQDAAERLSGIQTGTLLIGMVSTALYFLPKLLSEFKTDHPGVDVRISMGNRQKLLAWLRDGEIDMAIMGRPPKEISTRAEPFAAHPHVFVCSPSHILARTDDIMPAVLEAHPFIVREPGSGTLAALDRFFEQHRITPPVAMELESNEAVKQAVMAGLGISFLSLHTIKLELDQELLCVLDVVGAPVMRAWNLTYTLGKYLSPTAEAFRYFILERGEPFLISEFQEHHLNLMHHTIKP